MPDPETHLVVDCRTAATTVADSADAAQALADQHLAERAAAEAAGRVDVVAGVTTTPS